MNVYFISGMGADRRVFSRLTLPDHCRAHHLDWIAHEPGESLAYYALRLAEGIDKTSPFALVGLSMGGMIATEIAKAYAPSRTILISSATGVRQLPLSTRLLGLLPFEKLPPSWVRTPLPVAWRMQGANDPASRALVRDLLHDTDKPFLLWAARAVLGWRNSTLPPNLVRIHGTKDRIIPIQNVHPDHRIEGAGHLAVFTHAAEVSPILHSLL